MRRPDEAVAGTGLLVAAIRADETASENRLFADPFAARLAGEEGRSLLAAAIAETGEQTTAQIVVRTRYWDEALLRACATGVTQVVILAAGMDARAFRLPWPAGTTVYELDQPQVMFVKDGLLADVRPLADRVPIGIDLSGDWPDALRPHGFSSDRETVWLVEGLLQYLDAAAVRALFRAVDAMSAPGSVLLYDVVGAVLLDAPFLAPLKRFMADLGAPWRFATDAPGALAEDLGWSATVTDVAEPGYAWRRWSHPPAAASEAGVPRGYFVTAAKSGAGRRSAAVRGGVDASFSSNSLVQHANSSVMPSGSKK
jgi:methyltransferase (TIGR00027 family)